MLLGDAVNRECTRGVRFFIHLSGSFFFRRNRHCVAGCAVRCAICCTRSRFFSDTHRREWQEASKAFLQGGTTSRFRSELQRNALSWAASTANGRPRYPIDQGSAKSALYPATSAAVPPVVSPAACLVRGSGRMLMWFCGLLPDQSEILSDPILLFCVAS